MATQLEEMNQQAKEFKKKNSKFITLEEGESFKGQYTGVEKTTGQFGETRHYTFIVDGQEKIFNKASDKFLENMVKAGVEEGDKITVERTGTGYDSAYSVVNDTNIKDAKKEANEINLEETV